MMIMIMKTSGSQFDSPVAEGNRKEGGGRKMRDWRGFFFNLRVFIKE